MAKIADMQRTPEERAAIDAEMTCCYPDGSGYPYGLVITLRSMDIAKLGLKEFPTAGDTFMISGVAFVTSTIAEPGDDDGDRLELQITSLGLEPEQKRNNIRALYPSATGADDGSNVD